MRTEMQQIYNEISEIVMTEKELSTVSKNWNSSSTQPKMCWIRQVPLHLIKCT
jgi:hypothetical protein